MPWAAGTSQKGVSVLRVEGIWYRALAVKTRGSGFSDSGLMLACRIASDGLERFFERRWCFYGWCPGVGATRVCKEFAVEALSLR